VTACCSPNATPLTLHWSISGGGSGTTTYSGSISGWQITDATTGFAAKLQCLNVSGVNKWVFTATQAGCSATTTSVVVTCVPFHLTAHVVIAGTHCLFPATVNITVTA